MEGWWIDSCTYGYSFFPARAMVRSVSRPIKLLDSWITAIRLVRRFATLVLMIKCAWALYGWKAIYISLGAHHLRAMAHWKYPPTSSFVVQQQSEMLIPYHSSMIWYTTQFLYLWYVVCILSPEWLHGADRPPGRYGRKFFTGTNHFTSQVEISKSFHDQAMWGRMVLLCNFWTVRTHTLLGEAHSGPTHGRSAWKCGGLLLVMALEDASSVTTNSTP